MKTLATQFRLDYGAYILALIPYVILPFSPLLAFILAICVLFVFYKAFDDTSRILLGLSLCVSGSVIIASENVFMRNSDFFNYYFHVYEPMLRGQFERAFGYNGIECGLASIYFALIFIFGEMTPTNILITESLLVSVLFLVWFEKYAICDFSQSQKALCLVFVFVLFDFFIAVWTTRQAFSSIFILFAYSQTRLSRKLFFAFLAIIFHLSAAPLLLILESARRFPKLTITLLVVGIFLFIVSFEWLVTMQVNGMLDFIPGSGKLYAYYYSPTMLVATYNPFKVFIYAIIIVGLIFSHKSIESHWKYFLYVCLILGIGFNILSDHLALRVNMLFSSYLLGFFLFLVWRNYLAFTYILLACLLCFKIKVYLFNPHIFYAYPPFGSWFYYIL